MKLIKENLTEKERRFILSVKMGEPQWDLLEFEHIKNLPAVQWKLENINRMDTKKHQIAIDKLKNFLEL